MIVKTCDNCNDGCIGDDNIPCDEWLPEGSKTCANCGHKGMMGPCESHALRGSDPSDPRDDLLCETCTWWKPEKNAVGWIAIHEHEPSCTCTYYLVVDNELLFGTWCLHLCNTCEYAEEA